MKSEELNPVSKVRLIVDAMTNNPFIANKLMTGITSNLKGKEIHELFNELQIKENKQLKLKL
jgi:hypothetical protein|tara:strand:+ start:2517 stop:2702 length:186 start_codon:yes stop_codon:yes gene_type:complete